MRTLTEKYFGGLSLGKEECEADFIVVDRYQLFSTELLRLSLLGIAGYGFLIANIVLKVSTNGEYVLFGPFSESRTVWTLTIGATALGLSAATALGHRYFSTDCITHFVRRLRANKQCNKLPEGSPERKILDEIIKEERNSLEKDVEICRWLLGAASLFLVIGAICVALAFAFTLSGAREPKSQRRAQISTRNGIERPTLMRPPLVKG